MPEIQRVTTNRDIAAIAALATEIWTAHYVPIIGREQVRYMLNKFQSRSAIAAQLNRGYEYYLLTEKKQPAGYFALVPCPAESSVQLSKIYVRQKRRSRGLGRVILNFAEKRGRELKLRKVWLTVNRNNRDSIAFYAHMGFIRQAEIMQDIGNGFVLDDYRMVKTIGKECAPA